MQPDLVLIHEVQKRVSGANTHKVSGLLLKYRLAAKLEGRCGPAAGAEAKLFEVQLRRFVLTGKLEQ
jgi:hypothetical protein